ncbi:AI-2E family transporter [Bryobacterales bacterium F-183]|nr:AI-2E family transporter [Bryobacterales bacterium F-183]
MPVLTPSETPEPQSPSVTGEFSATGSFLAAKTGVPPPLGYRISLAVIAAAAGIALLYFGRVFFITVISAVIIAFLLDPLVLFFMKLKLGRGSASFVVCSLAVLFLYLAGLGVVTEIASLAEDAPVYSERVNALVQAAITKLEEFEKSVTLTILPRRAQPEAPVTPDTRSVRRRGVVTPPATQQPQPGSGIPEVRIHQEQTPFYQIAYGYISSMYTVLLMASFVPFLVYFMLAWRDHLRARFLSLFRGERRTAAAQGWSRVAEVARAYVLGNFLLGVLLGAASAIFFASIQLPYWLLIGPVSGFLSIVPYLGLPLAIAPPVFAALPVHTEPAMYVFIAGVVSLLHLLALNLVYPKFVGSRVHLNPLVVTLALMFWGTLWGGIGLLLGVPITAGIKALCDSVDSLKAYGKLMGD